MFRSKLAIAVTALAVTSAGTWAHEDQAIIELVEGAQIEDINDDYGTIELGRIESRRIYLLEVPDELPEGVEDFEDYIETDDRVRWADPDYEGEAAEGQTESFYLIVDPQAFQDQYVRERVRLGDAHDVTRGEGVVVAVLDTGVDVDHPLLRDRVVPGGYNFVDDNEDLRDIGDGDMVGHGTFVAGLIAMMAPEAGVLPIKVLDSEGLATSFRVAQGIYYAMEQGADVINLSLVVPEEDDEEYLLLEKAVTDARAGGVVVVAAAGNLDSDDETYPAGFEEVVGVAGTDDADRKSEFSNFGPHLALSAPSVAVVSAVPGAAFAEWQGTSISAAIVSGAAALVKSLDLDATPSMIESALVDNAADIYRENPPLNREYEEDQELGSGRLDAAAAVGSAVEIIPADLNADGVVDFADLLILLSAWGSTNSPADLDGNGLVDFSDLLLLLAEWS